MSVIGAYARAVHLCWVLVREGVVSSLPSEGLPPVARFAQKLAGYCVRNRANGREQSDNLAKAVERLGPSYIKIGQFLATRPDVVGKRFAADLATLQDRLPTFPMEAAKAQIEGALGLPMQTLFERFDPPLAAASIAQVHAAYVRTTNGLEKRAVKVIRPGVRTRFARDLEVNFALAHLQERFMPNAKRLRPVAVAKTLEQTTRIEMDLRLEAAALSELHDNTQNDPGFRVPFVDWERTGRDVVTMEWIDGLKMSDIEGLKKAGHDLPQLAALLMQSFLKHTLRDGFFHADMHQGNLFVEKDGTIVAVDMGIVGRLNKSERRFLAEILFGFITRDYQRVADTHFEAGYVPAHHDRTSFAQAIRAIGEPIHGQSAETISMARLLTLLFEVTELFDMETRTELIMLQKTMVVVEGVCRSLDPKFNMWKTSEPVVEGWIRDNLGPKRIGTDLVAGITALAKLAEAGPEILASISILHRDLMRTSHEGLRLDEQSTNRIGRAKARFAWVSQSALWTIALSLFVIALQLSFAR